MLSLLVHAAGGWYSFTQLSPPKLETRSETTSAPLIARLQAPEPVAVPTPAPALAPVPAHAPSRPVRARTPRTTTPTKAAVPPDTLSTPPITTPTVVEATPAPEPTPSPAPPVSAPIAVPTPPPRTPPQVADLSAYIALQRATMRAIGDPDLDTGPDDRRSGSAAEIDNRRRDRIIAGNLAGTNHRGTGYDQNGGGGIFRIKRMGSDDAEFWFAGFNKDMERRTQQVIDVRKGDSPDIHIAVVRKMIAIIRDEVQGDFRWQSRKLGRDIWLSARPVDDAALQDTLLRDLFPDWSMDTRR